MADAASEYEKILHFWFGTLNAQGRADEARAKKWFEKDELFDQSIREQFGGVHAAVVAGEREDWLEVPQGRLAYVIVLDQFSRNMFRGTARMFAHDAQALEAARGAVERGWDKRAAFDERGFFYMPFMHSEALADQERCVALFSAFRDELEGAARDRIGLALDFAERHRAIVARFGRFPHRNAWLGRASTPEESAFLEQPGSSF
jgi:uncharacterized protein (DUF924 family)